MALARTKLMPLMRLRQNIYAFKNDRTARSRGGKNRFQKFRVRRTCPITGKLVEMPILMIKRHFLLAHQAFKNRTGNRKLIPYLTETEYRFLFEGISPKQSDGVVLQDLTPKRNDTPPGGALRLR